MLLHYWQCQERVHYPHARENVEFFRKKIRDSVIEQESAQAEAALPDTAAFEAANPPFGGGIG